MKTILSLSLLLFACVYVSAQPKRPTSQKPNVPPTNAEPATEQDPDTLKIDTNLVTVPVIASSRPGSYIADLTKEEFKISEDGTAQQVAFLATVNAPFNVVLLLDTSGSTKEKLPLIQRAAIAFINQLSTADKVKVISFDDSVRDLNDFTSDKALLSSVISKTTPGQNTKVYDAVEMALNSLRPLNGRKAIVMFSDAVDWHSDQASFEGTLKNLDESGVIFYPIRFDTRVETEALARQQDAEQNGSGLPTSEVIRTTPTTFPTDDPPSVPNQRGTSLPDMIFKRPNIPRPQETPQGSPTDPFPSTMPTRRTTTTTPTSTTGSGGTSGTAKKDDSISAMFNQLYLMADSYLARLAEQSGGQVYRADSVAALPQAFAAIAAELRTQYLLGYYPTNRNKDGSYRKIQVKTTRKDVSIRSRPGYRAAG
jgi:hypothetical protein